MQSLAVGSGGIGASRSFLRKVNELAGIGTYVIDLQQRTIAVSAEMARVFGAGDESLTLPLDEFRARYFHPDDLALLRAKADAVYSKAENLQVEIRIVRGDGQVIWVRSSSGSELGERGEPLIVGVIHDVTEARHARGEAAARSEQLRHSEARFRTLIEKAPVAIGISRAERNVYVNEKFLAVWGFDSNEELVGRPIDEHWAPDVSRLLAERVRDRSLGLVVAPRWEGEAMRKDGTRFQAEVDVVAIELPDGPATMAFITDVTELRRADAALRESEQRFRQIAETIDAVFWMIDPREHRTLYVSPAFERIWGRPSAEVYASPEAWLQSVHPDDRARVREAMRTKTRTGEYRETYRILRADGDVRWIRDRAFPVHDPSGEVRRVVGTALDVTEQHELEAQLLQAQKMEAIGVLAGGVAHDFNNLLSVILGYSSMLKASVSATDPMFGDLQEIQAAGERATALTRQLLAFSRRQVFELRVIALSQTLGEIEKMLRRLIGEDIELRTVGHPSELHVFSDPLQIEQVLMNLAVNARDAMPNGGELTISLGHAEVGVEEAARLEIEPGGYATISVRDTGIGMDAATMARVFEPFFTTKPIGKGTGLGLATVFGIVRQSHGHIAVSSELGHGTTFRILLPQVAGMRATSPPESAGEETARRTETVLVVEDDPSVRRLVHGVLSRHGYRVLEAQSAGDALLLSEHHREAIDILLTDVVMPLMKGEELAGRLLAARPGLRVIYMSGYPQLGGRSEFSPPGEFVAKPFTPEKLLRSLADKTGRALPLRRRDIVTR